MANITVASGKTSLASLIQNRKERTQVFSGGASKAVFQGVFMFDVTSSMFEYFDICRKNIPNIMTQIRKQLPESEFSLGYFRNHGDELKPGGMFSLTPFLGSEREISERISGIKKGGGGDGRCCIEECLQAANKLAWGSQSAKALVAVVDTYPNGVKERSGACLNGIRYSDEVGRLRKMGVKVYTVFAGDNVGVMDFYQDISDQTGGRLISISDMNLMTDILVAIAMKETGNLDKYIRNREETGKITQKAKQELLLLR